MKDTLLLPGPAMTLGETRGPVEGPEVPIQHNEVLLMVVLATQGYS